MTVTTAPPYPKKYTTPFLLYPPVLWPNKLGSEFADRYLELDKPGGDYVMYVSIPFCRVRCYSCPYFVAHLSPHDPRDSEQRYVDALIADLRRWSSYPKWRDGKLRAVYIGGGTGSILKTENIRRIVDTIVGEFPLAEGYELTLEGNARDYTPDKLDYVADSPISRASLGVQSFNEQILRVIGSPHAAEQSSEVINTLSARGFDNIQLDMMYNHFARPGYENVYNEWTFKKNMIEVLGVGPGAYGFVNDYRIGTKKDVEEYIATVGDGRHMISAVAPQCSPQVRRERWIVNALQYLGLGLAAYRGYFGTDLVDDFASVVDRLVARGLAVVTDERLDLTELGREWHMNVMLEFTNDAYWGDTASLESPHWAMNTPMVDLFAGGRAEWLGV
jgi:coproporphyrinogen III oxidase-like Fe-S oxidoreductase